MAVSFLSCSLAAAEAVLNLNHFSTSFCLPGTLEPEIFPEETLYQDIKKNRLKRELLS